MVLTTIQCCLSFELRSPDLETNLLTTTLNLVAKIILQDSWVEKRTTEVATHLNLFSNVSQIWMKKVLFFAEKGDELCHNTCARRSVTLLFTFCQQYCKIFFEIEYMYSQTCSNNHLSTRTSIIRPRFLFYKTKQHLNNDLLSTTATIYRSRGWSLQAWLFYF